ncbi:histidine phosphatase family protein [Fictibacillus phosphorivorans]|uniref:histidine phosphatase family protein n=1 Tax=Fictibacillus phosphorivorans TaxID=1221500 RepID=UPI00119E01AD|nr:histidine phosphatase family protein [Fictibacillus phosphorivorans]
MIYVIRHGETDLNKEKRLQGRSGLALNQVGITQAERLKEQLKDISFDYVFSSPQERAIQTAEIATGKKVSIDNRLDVFDLGEADQLKKSEVIFDGFIPDSNQYKGVENIKSYVERVFSFLRELEVSYRSDMQILLSGHRCTTGCIGAYFQGIPQDQNLLEYSSENGEYKTYEFNNFVRHKR